MRGLNIRCEFVRAKNALQITNNEKNKDALFGVCLDAEEAGIYDFRAGLDEVPNMFAGEPALLLAWAEGYAFAAACAAMAQCGACRNRTTGSPCPIHG